jgi:hypothetical protein
VAKLPAPPHPLPVPAITTILRAGTRLWRVYFAGGAHPATWNGFRFFGPTHARFDHHDLPKGVHETKAIFYAADDLTTCLAEVFQAKRIINRTSSEPRMVGFDLLRDVLLLDLTGFGPRKRARRWRSARGVVTGRDSGHVRSTRRTRTSRDSFTVLRCTRIGRPWPSTNALGRPCLPRRFSIARWMTPRFCAASARPPPGSGMASCDPPGFLASVVCARCAGRRAHMTRGSGRSGPRAGAGAEARGHGQPLGVRAGHASLSDKGSRS